MLVDVPSTHAQVLSVGILKVLLSAAEAGRSCVAEAIYGASYAKVIQVLLVGDLGGVVRPAAVLLEGAGTVLEAVCTANLELRPGLVNHEMACNCLRRLIVTR